MLPFYKEKIYVIGDSHCKSFHPPNFEHRWIGPRTAHQLKVHDAMVQEELNSIPITSPVLFSFGEIDCRIHIFMQYKRYYTAVDQAIKNTVDRYLDYLASLYVHDMYVLNVVPTGKQENAAGYPYYGTQEDRTVITTVFNSVLKISCRDRGMNFINVYDQLINKHGERREDLIADATHLNEKYGQIVYDKYFKRAEDNDLF